MVTKYDARTSLTCRALLWSVFCRNSHDVTSFFWNAQLSSFTRIRTD